MSVRNVEDSSSRVQRASFVSGRSSRSSEEKQGISNGHGYHHGCTCEKCSQRKEEKRMLIEYNEKLRALIKEKEKIIKRLYTENNTIKQCKEVIISTTSEKQEKVYKDSLEYKQKEVEKLRKELLDKNVIIEQLNVNVKEFKIIIERHNADLEKLMKIEAENCELRAKTQDYQNQLGDLQTLLKQETEKEESSDIVIFEDITQKIEERINSACNKLDKEYYESSRKALEDLRQNFISKIEFEQKVKDSEAKYNKLVSIYESLLDEKRELLNGNQALNSLKKEIETQKRKLEIEINRVIEENKDLKISLSDIKKLYNQKIVDFERLTNEVELHKKSCKDRVYLRGEIDIYGKLVGGSDRGAVSESGSGTSSASSSDNEVDRKKEANSYEASKAQAYNFETRTRVRKQVRQEIFQEAASKGKKN